MQPLQNDLRCPAPKDSSITHAAAAPSNLDAAIKLRSAQTELQNTKELRTTTSEIATPKPDCQRQNWENLVPNHYRRLDAAIPIRFTM